MNQNQEQKLKALITSSPILNTAERAEWLALLELMNDKQLGELEKILVLNQVAVNSAQSTVGVQANKQVNNLKNQSTSNNKKLSTNNSVVTPEKQLPHLSHIVNLPNHWSEKSANAKGLNVPSKELAHKNTEKNKINFASKLKNIFSKKELTTTRNEFPLEIPEHAGNLEVSKQPQVLKQDVPTVHLPEKESIQKVVKTGLVNQPPLVPKPKNSPLITNKPLSEPWQPGKSSPIPKDAFAPGVNLKKQSEELRLKTLENIKKHVEESAELNQVGTLEDDRPLNKNINLSNPEDLKKITVEFLESSDFPTLVNKIKDLVRRFGYFKVIFDLEQSAAYKAYIATGLKLLLEDNENEKILKERVLEKPVFEKFADLLAKIQVV